MSVLPEAKIRCPKCHSTIADIDPKWIAKAAKGENSQAWAVIRRCVLGAWKEFGPLKGWMTQGECCEKDCDGKWWDGVKLNVAVPHHLKMAKQK